MTVDPDFCAEVLAAYGIDVADLAERGAVLAAELADVADEIAQRIVATGQTDPDGEGDRSAHAPWVPLPPPRWPAPDMAVATAALLRWFEDRGGDLSALEIRVHPSGQRTVHARRAIASGERVLAVERALMIDSEVVRASPLGEALMNAGIAHEHGLLAAFLARERSRADSPWRVVLESLPVTDPGGPISASADQLAALRGTDAHIELHRVRRMILDEDSIASATPEIPPAELADLAWARTLVSSRVFRIVHGGVPSLAIVPIADLLDHGFGDTTYKIDEATGRFEIVAARDLAIGEELHTPYGNKSNSALLAGYGFVLADNGHDEAPLLFPPGAPGVRQAIFARLVANVPLVGWRRIKVGYRYDERMIRALSAARALCSDPDELAAAISGGLVTGRDLPWIGEQTEAAALVLIGRAARDSLDVSPDLGALPAEASHVEQMVATYRRGQREVLEGVIQLVERAPAFIVGDEQIPYRGQELWSRLLNDYLTSYLQGVQFVFG